MPASPFQASGETSPSKNDDLPRTIAGSTPLPLGRRSFAVSGPLAPVRSASYPVPVRRLTGSFHASFSVRLTTNALRFPSVPATRFREDFHLQVIAHAGPTTDQTGEPVRRTLPFPNRLSFGYLTNRDGGIRTRDPLNPIQVRYRTALRPEDWRGKLTGGRGTSQPERSNVPNRHGLGAESGGAGRISLGRRTGRPEASGSLD